MQIPSAAEIYTTVANPAEKLNSVGKYVEQRNTVLDALDLHRIEHLIHRSLELPEQTDPTQVKTMHDLAAASGLIRVMLSRIIAKQYPREVYGSDAQRLQEALTEAYRRDLGLNSEHVQQQITNQ